MNKEKQFYVTPEVQTFVIRFEGVICESLNGSGGNGFTEPGADVEDGNPSIYW